MDWHILLFVGVSGLFEIVLGIFFLKYTLKKRH